MRQLPRDWGLTDAEPGPRAGGLQSTACCNDQYSPPGIVISTWIHTWIQVEISDLHLSTYVCLQIIP